MANEIQELLAEIKDERLKNRLTAAVGELRKTKKFGLVFEEHLPELLPIYSSKVRSQSRVARKDGRLTETFIVQRVIKGVATVVSESGDSEPYNIPTAELVVVKRFGEAIFPTLRHVESVQRGGNSPHHTLIEADNYHALQLLEWLYAGKVDCIYIDPPYNTGARDWKYNNSFVDRNDSYRHSKWLSWMKKRLLLAGRLLSETGYLCVTIDDYEIHHLLCLIESHVVSLEVVGQVIIRNNPQGRSTQRGFSVNHEYALFLIRKGAEIPAGRLLRTAQQQARYPLEDSDGAPFFWENLRKSGSDSDKQDRPRQFYPIYWDGKQVRIPEMQWSSTKRTWEHIKPAKKNEVTLWPIRITKDGKKVEKVWKEGEESVRLQPDLFAVRELRGVLQVFRKNKINTAGMLPPTWWSDSKMSATEHGTNMIADIFGADAFPFPKSVYAVADCIRVCSNKTDSLVLDFFAGSGTTLNAVALLNAADGGTRRCILVTNNEVHPESRAKELISKGQNPADQLYEKNGICQAVTFPRSKFVINGRRDDGTELSGEYLSGRFEQKEVRRDIRPLDFATTETLASKKARTALAGIVGFTKSKVIEEQSFLLAEGEGVAVLLDPVALDAFIEQGEEWADSIETIYLPFPSGRAFNQAKEQLIEAWPPLVKTLEIKRPMKDGFPANLDYFRLDFLERSLVETGGRLADVLPTLWMMAGCRGNLPICKDSEKMMFFNDCRFAVLVDESAIKSFLNKLGEHPNIDWVFLVTNDQDSFSRICEWLPKHIPASQRIHLWRNYVDNFLINIDHASMGDSQ